MKSSIHFLTICQQIEETIEHIPATDIGDHVRRAEQEYEIVAETLTTILH